MATTYRPSTRPTGRRPLTNLRSNPASPFRHVDMVLVACVLGVSAFGALMVYSTTRGPEEPYDSSYLVRVLGFIVVGTGLMAAAALFDYRKLRDFWPFIYGGSLLLLVGVLIPGIGSSINWRSCPVKIPWLPTAPSKAT